MATIIAQQQKWLLRKYHTLCTRLGMSADDKLALLAGYGVESSKELSVNDLMEVCDRLDSALNPENRQTEQLRKRVIAAIGGWLRLVGKECGMEYIKAVACRATGCSTFNRIPPERLANLYNLFLKKQRDARAVNAVCGEIAYRQRFGQPQQLN